MDLSQKALLRQKKGISEKHVVLSVGRFIHLKGYDVLLKSAGLLGDDVGIYIIGGQVTEEYQQLVQEYKLKNIHFIDFMPPQELKDYFEAADVFVLPTREDVWGLVINEAMAAGLPVVTTDRCVAGIELIKDDVNGYVVPVDDHEALAAAMDKVLQDDALRSHMAEKNLKDIQKYTYEDSGTDVLAAINGVYKAAYQRN
jgi:glycosyltransferase involved in cell wall biosynthesis